MKGGPTTSLNKHIDVDHSELIAVNNITGISSSEMMERIAKLIVRHALPLDILNDLDFEELLKRRPQEWRKISVDQ